MYFEKYREHCGLDHFWQKGSLRSFTFDHNKINSTCNILGYKFEQN